ncbi:MAG: RNA 2',3'-cyclic phosphodiesterase [Nanoarchaeota archaeon]|nr:RNA 2',3'-cyclic phosphodiesterase [Nanoarchaeota archaeon]MBU1027961.1 RNA 2',3'-cyclic phosphodiesterase [Nanoarchaeota archaeon]
MNIRCFISIDVPEKIQKEIKKIQNSLPEFVGKTTELENLHLTLKFLGEISKEKVEGVKTRLSKIKFNNFEVELNNLGVFSENFIRIVWLNLKGAEKFQKEIDFVLEGLFEFEKRFMGHLTIARIKNIKDKKQFLSDLKKIKIPRIKFSVNCFKLKSSMLRNKGPVYEAIGKYNLE